MEGQGDVCEALYPLEGKLSLIDPKSRSGRVALGRFVFHFTVSARESHI